MKAIEELDVVVLRRALPEFGLKPGDLGTVVHRYGRGAAVEVEFVTASGDTVAVATLEIREVRRMRKHEILHVREIGA
jgi:hypothetical protein